MNLGNPPNGSLGIVQVRSIYLHLVNSWSEFDLAHE